MFDNFDPRWSEPRDRGGQDKLDRKIYHGSRRSAPGALVMIVDCREALTAPLSERVTFGNYVMAASSAIVCFRGCIKAAAARAIEASCSSGLVSTTAFSAS